MPTNLARLFGRGRPRKGTDRAYSLRLAAALMETQSPQSVLEAACRLSVRTDACDVAMIGSWSDGPDALCLELVTGRARRLDLATLTKALGGRNSVIDAHERNPRWVQLDEDQFQPGAPLLRRFDLQWALALPFTADIDDRPRCCFALFAGRGRDMDLAHPLVRDARLIWLTTRGHLTAGTEARTPGRAWPGADGWDEAPTALAVVRSGTVLAANQHARTLLEGNVGRNGQEWETWLAGAVQHLDMTGAEREVLVASRSRDRRLEVAMTPAQQPGEPRLVSLHEVAAAEADTAGQEATMRMLGHELRTPLTAMKTSLDLVLRGDTGPLNADQERFLGTAHRNLGRLNRLLGDLLDAKRAEAGKLAINAETVDLGALLQEDLGMFAVACREKGIALDATGVPASFRACVDADKVQQMLHNVVSNAIKYTPKDGLVRVWLQERADSTPGRGARLARAMSLPLDAFTLVVEDSGMGMSEEFLETLFQPFTREDRAETLRLPGAGLGLHITRGLAEAHGGEVRLTSQPGHGTTVWLVLPREPGSGRVLGAGRRLDAMIAAATAAGADFRPVRLDIRGRLAEVQPWDLDAAGVQVCEFMSGLAREARGDSPRHLLRTAGEPCWQLAAGLWAAVALDPGRLEAAWQVATSAPESSRLLAGTSWHDLEDATSEIFVPDADRFGTPVG